MAGAGWAPPPFRPTRFGAPDGRVKGAPGPPVSFTLSGAGAPSARRPPGRRRRDREPVPARADHLPEGADGDAAQLLGQRLRCAHQVAHAGRLPLAPDADGERRDLTPAGALGLECAAVQDKGDAAWIVLA